MAEKYPEEECFLEMIRFIQKDFTEPSFQAYKNKVTRMLEKSQAQNYPEIVFHLEKMNAFGLDDEFNQLLRWIKEKYSRRRNLMAELRRLDEPKVKRGSAKPPPKT